MVARSGFPPGESRLEGYYTHSKGCEADNFQHPEGRGSRSSACYVATRPYGRTLRDCAASPTCALGERSTGAELEMNEPRRGRSRRAVALNSVGLLLLGLFVLGQVAGLPASQSLTAMPTAWRGVFAGWVGGTEWSSNHYAFLNVRADGTPVRWEKSTITYSVSEAATSSDVETVAKAMRVLSDATGFEFRMIGRTRLIPSTTNIIEAEADVTIAWVERSDTDAFRNLGPDSLAAGFGLVGDGAYAKGAVAVDSAKAPTGNELQRVVMHEMGHVLGLEHVSDKTQLMAADLTMSWGLRLGSGDLKGLRLVGYNG